MKKLILITDNYPFSRGELPFLQPELRETMKKFEVTIVCKSPLEKQEYLLPDGVKLLHYKPVFRKTQILANIARCLVSPGYYHELFDKRNPGLSLKKKDSDIRNFRIGSYDFHRWMKQQGLFDDISNTVFYSYWYNPGAIALAIEKKHQPKIKIVTRTHNYDLFNERCVGGRQPYRCWADQYMDRVFFVSRAGRDYYLKQFATQPEEHYRLAYLGVSDNGLCPQGDKDVLKIFSCANLIPVKRIELTIQALALIDDIEISWVHAGGGSEEENLKALAQKLLGNKNNCTYRFLGSVPNEKVIKFYQENPVDVFLTTSEREGAPVSIMEALSFGVPVIGPAIDGIPEMLDSDNGILISKEALPHETEHAIRTFAAQTQEERKQMKLSARKKWERDFCAQTNHAKFAQELAEL